MRIRFWLALMLVMLLGCTPTLPQLTSQPESSSDLTPVSQAERAETETAAKAYLDAWQREDYDSMYSLLTPLSQDAISKDEFLKHYRGVAAEAALSSIDYEVLSSLVKPESAQVNYQVTLHSLLVGDITRDTVMNLSRDKDEWRVQWDDMLVLPELQGGNYLRMERGGFVPSRANIYDRNGHALVAQTDATAIGLYPDQIDPSQAGQLFELLTELTGLSAETIQGMYASYPPGQDWYLPLGEVSADRVAQYSDALNSLSGVAVNSYKARYYFDGGVAPHVLGYVGAIQPEEVDLYKRKGYRQDERVGRSGLEKWGEAYLAGRRGGALYVVNDQGKLVTQLATAEQKPSQAIFTTLDKEFQMAVEQALSSFRGAAVVLERDTGRVLAMASSPGFDPNAFEPLNLNSDALLSAITNDPSQPLLNRATQGQYPLGSVFKIITMAAALESGHYNADTTYQCGYFFEEYPGLKLNDWTYEYFLGDHKTIPSGLLTLSQGLIRSCNPYFWHIGLDLYNRGLETAVADMARDFGLSRPTGIEGLDEASGQVNDPENAVDAINMAIGQGDLLVTPLQVATFIAAVGNGGTLYRPQVVERIAPPDGDPVYQFVSEEIGKLPLKPSTLKTLQDALVGVIRSEKPRGTAWHRFTGLDIPVAGKTGTAQAGSGMPHAWFAGYTFAEREDFPDIAAVVVVENAGEGSDYAAPIFRRIVELYFSGQPQKLYPWESSYNVTSTPFFNELGTPQPPGNATPQP